jgi:hypothetical protein
VSRSAFARSRSSRSKMAACSLAYASMAEAASEAASGSGPVSAFLRPNTRPIARSTTFGKERSLRVPNKGRLISLMIHILNRPAPIVVILLSTILLSGCAGLFGSSPREQADEAISAANESISEHNELFDQARSTYSDVKDKIESGEDPSKEKDNITAAKNDLQEARTHLQDAEGSLATVDDLDVDPAIKKYAGLLSEAMQDQLDAEAKEIDFYGILEQDPSLANDREEALDLLSEVGEGYQKAEETYREAQDLADENPKLIEGN